MLIWHPKDPDEAVRYGIDFVDRLDAGVTLSSASWVIAPAGVTKSAEVVSGTQASALLSVGTLGESYLVTCTAVSSDGQTLEETAILDIRRR